MMRKVMFVLTVAAGVVMGAGCKDNGPTSSKFDPIKGGAYSNQGQYTRGAGTGGAQTTTTTTE